MLHMFLYLKDIYRLDAGCEVLRNSETRVRSCSVPSVARALHCPRVSELRSTSHPASNLFSAELASMQRARKKQRQFPWHSRLSKTSHERGRAKEWN